MAGLIEGAHRDQATLFPECLEDWVSEDHPVRVVDLFVDELDLAALGFHRHVAAPTGRPGYPPAVPLKLFIYGYLNRIPSSRRLEREAGRNVELMWLTGRLVPDHKTIADFWRENGPAVRRICAEFVELCRRIGVLKGGSVAVDGEPSSRRSTIATGTSHRPRSPAAWRIWRRRSAATSRRRTAPIGGKPATRGRRRSRIWPGAPIASGWRGIGW